MANYNKVILIGNLTRDPQLRYTPSQMAVCDFGLAMNRRWRTPEGEQREEVCFVDVTAWGKQAETLAKYVTKGRQLFVEGRLTFSQWDDKSGQKRSKLTVTVEQFQFLGGPGGGRGGPAQARPAGEQAAPAAGENAPEFNQDKGLQEEEDIPF